MLSLFFKLHCHDKLTKFAKQTTFCITLNPGIKNCNESDSL